MKTERKPMTVEVAQIIITRIQQYVMDTCSPGEAVVAAYDQIQAS